MTNGGGKPPPTEAMIALSPRSPETMRVPIVGLTPLITNRFDEKAKRMMLEGMQSKTRKRKEPKDPEAEYQRARYRYDDERDGIPGTAFKGAIVGAARMFDGITMTALKVCIYVHGDGPDMLVPIEGKPVCREDVTRIPGSADLRYRPMYDPWRVVLDIDFIPSLITAESVLALVEAAGFGGVGEWRPSAPRGLTGVYGRFSIDDERISK